MVVLLPLQGKRRWGRLNKTSRRLGKYNFSNVPTLAEIAKNTNSEEAIILY
jgi:hypothetical protein